MGGDVEQDFATQWRDGIADTADGEPQGVFHRHADGHRSAHQLPKLLGEPGRHFQRMGVDDFAAKVAFDASALGGRCRRL